MLNGSVAAGELSDGARPKLLWRPMSAVPALVHEVSCDVLDRGVQRIGEQRHQRSSDSCAAPGLLVGSRNSSSEADDSLDSPSHRGDNAHRWAWPRRI